jgi:undecaprenyl-diphosphatase
MQSLDSIAKFFLIFGQEFVLVPLVIIGFLVLNKKTYGNALFLLLFTMIFNPFLKSIFQIPLAEHLNKPGYAFPSGHMQTAIVFYGWLLIAHKNTLVRSIVSIILVGIGCALIQLKYHNLYDVLGAVLFGILTLFIYAIVLQIKLFMEKPFLLGYILIALSIGLLLSMNSLLKHTSMAFMVLVGFTLSWTIFSDSIDLSLK